ncbi:AI-2E family transporter [Romboutsia sp. CE17]|uniref:AI-2E family transporter n=1 Tax=Romboutsia sp. CE17 TaxID=2724150 RepID=UPI001442C9AD|nr:AI-2E family transporter [Romboutsia sp. CE17]QJA08659.1 AI-2E family transporter [Romboutsia sp. CE17]
MISKEDIKHYILLAFITILLYKFINSPIQFISGIGGIAGFFSPFLIGALIALLINPLVMFFEKKFNLHRLLNILISYIIVFVVLFLGFKLLIPSIVDTLNTLIKEIPTYINMFNEILSKYMTKAEFFNAIAPHIQDNLNSILTNLVNILTAFSSNLLIHISSITSILFDIIMGLILSIYMIFDKEKIAIGCKKILYATVSKRKADETVEFFRMSHEIFYDYMIGKIIDSLIIGVIAFIGFQFIIKIENVLFLSFIVFVTNIIPYFGPFIGAVPPILMTLVYSPIKAFWVAIFILILQQLDGNFIGPKVMGDQVGLSPLWIISAVLIGSSLFGLIGVFLSVPVAAVMKSSIDKYIEKRLYINDSK